MLAGYLVYFINYFQPLLEYLAGIMPCVTDEKQHLQMNQTHWVFQFSMPSIRQRVYIHQYPTIIPSLYHYSMPSIRFLPIFPRDFQAKTAPVGLNRFLGEEGKRHLANTAGLFQAGYTSIDVFNTGASVVIK